MSPAATVFLNYPQAAQHMAQIIVDRSRTPEVVDLVARLTNSLAPGDYQSEAAVLAAAARDGIRYMADPSTEDLFKNPALTYRQGMGDCNNKVILFGSLARAAGFPVRMMFVFDSLTPDLVNGFPVHVLASIEVYKGERSIESWWPVELTPLPDKVNGFPRYNQPMGRLHIPAGYSYQELDVDQLAA